MDRSWYVVYTVDISKPPKNLVYLRRKVIDLSTGADLMKVDTEFTDYVNRMGNMNVKVDDRGYNKNIQDAYLFAYIVDIVNMLEDMADENKYNAHAGKYERDIYIEEIEYRRIQGTIYDIYIKVSGNVSRKDIDDIEKVGGSFELLSNNLELPKFYGRSEFVVPFDYPNNMWILDNNYIVLQRYENADRGGMLRGPLGIVEIE
ncbi:Hypothetical protein ORPV_86 [Orpheovirus IHUMI-LCC2]|uniref:Uncharacterized protein n=1 Tax=Orpheovirus IHUMI-LCC2 TaxID=2023057 RepID=A0A2I2L3A3_9VIRU|nr:Hypothetical protein ORPV_86 [Orpheovirus IHUMI-LCC2]SNW61990.1 Hypothetical protein ORPV_86 [Orpheovirus IHUMI-LCC2]